ncbi:hypothetical protein LTR85_007290 [Meristemomyces frigidus]|nr:hypothetical protein LTR85_007290 [Meristemomyces frigidus]
MDRLDCDDEPASAGRHVQELEDALQSRRTSRMASTATETQMEDGEVTGAELSSASRRYFISVGGHDVELKDSWVGARDGRDWDTPKLRSPSPPPRPAQFQGRQSLDSWIARRDGRDWPAPPARKEAARGRGSPVYEPYAAPAGRGREPRAEKGGGRRKREFSRERAEGRQEANRQQKVSREAEARRDSRRDDPLGRSTPQRAAPAASQPQPQRKAKDRQAGNHRDLTRARSREGSRTPDRVQGNRVGKAYQQQRAMVLRDEDTARRVLDEGKRALNERRRQTEERHARSRDVREAEKDGGDEISRRMSGASCKAVTVGC